MSAAEHGETRHLTERAPLSPVGASDAVWAAARAVVDAPAYPYPRARAIFALKEALQDYDDLIARMAAHIGGGR